MTEQEVRNPTWRPHDHDMTLSEIEPPSHSLILDAFGHTIPCYFSYLMTLLMKYAELKRSAQQASWDVHPGRMERRLPPLCIAIISAGRWDSCLPGFGNASRWWQLIVLITGRKHAYSLAGSATNTERIAACSSQSDAGRVPEGSGYTRIKGAVVPSCTLLQGCGSTPMRSRIEFRTTMVQPGIRPVAADQLLHPPLAILLLHPLRERSFLTDTVREVHPTIARPRDQLKSWSLVHHVPWVTSGRQQVGRGVVARVTQRRHCHAHQVPIAAKRKALNWRAVFSSCWVYLWDFQRLPYYFISGKCIGRFNACPLTSLENTQQPSSEMYVLFIGQYTGGTFNSFVEKQHPATHFKSQVDGCLKPRLRLGTSSLEAMGPRWCSGHTTRLPHSQTGFDFRRGRSHMWESCRTMPLVGQFPRGSQFPPPFRSGAAAYSRRFTHIGSQDPNVLRHSQISPLHSNPRGNTDIVRALTRRKGCSPGSWQRPGDAVTHKAIVNGGFGDIDKHLLDTAEEKLVNVKYPDEEHAEDTLLNVGFLAEEVTIHLQPLKYIIVLSLNDTAIITEGDGAAAVTSNRSMDVVGITVVYIAKECEAPPFALTAAMRSDMDSAGHRKWPGAVLIHDHSAHIPRDTIPDVFDRIKVGQPRSQASISSPTIRSPFGSGGYRCSNGSTCSACRAMYRLVRDHVTCTRVPISSHDTTTIDLNYTLLTRGIPPVPKLIHLGERVSIHRGSNDGVPAPTLVVEPCDVW
ncbi:hypothetical protein PR048_010132 [Dryococelus australis]|uniref:Uncharacterized protein n=1 Tax=Dryococelus australis TaxID=614101 RepID=A0ABQ9I1W3_9NEOP|nr:hypothetical protein PR048_010132 [Dryococelus australis]